MAHFAELDSDNVVIRVLVFDNTFVDQHGGDLSVDVENYIESTTPHYTADNSYSGKAGVAWKQTSYNNSFRKQFAGIGCTYDSSKDKFIANQPFSSWTLDGNDDWESPTPIPTTSQRTYSYNSGTRLYKTDWDESAQKWKGLKQEDYEEGGSQDVYYWNPSNTTWEVE